MSQHVGEIDSHVSLNWMTEFKDYFEWYDISNDWMVSQDEVEGARTCLVQCRRSPKQAWTTSTSYQEENVPFHSARTKQIIVSNQHGQHSSPIQSLYITSPINISFCCYWFKSQSNKTPEKVLQFILIRKKKYHYFHQIQHQQKFQTKVFFT